MKKYIALLLLLPLLLSLFSCGDGGTLPEDSQLKQEAEALIKKSLVLNELFFEKGIPLKEGGITGGTYAEADLSAYAAQGFRTLSDIKAYMHTVYSNAATADLIRFAIDKRTDGLTLLHPAYCYDLYSDEKENPVWLALMVSTEGLHQQTDSLVYDYSTMEVVADKKTPTSATLTIKATITSKTGEEQSRVVRVRLVLEENGWRLDTLTCLSYQNKTDKLEGLDDILKKV